MSDKQKALLKQLKIIKTGLEQTNELIETLILTVDKITDEQVKELVSSCSLLDFLADKFKAQLTQAELDAAARESVTGGEAE